MPLWGYPRGDRRGEASQLIAEPFLGEQDLQDFLVDLTFRAGVPLRRQVTPDGLDDRVQPRGCTTPYILQIRRQHKHYGCVAWVEHGLLVPRYVHGDYDLYAIVPAGKAFSLDSQPVRAQPMLAHMDLPQRMGLAARVAREAERTAHSPTDPVGQLSLKVSTTINLRIARTEPGIPGALMVNHGEQVNLGGSAVDFQPVLAFLAAPRQGEYALELSDRESHEAFYASA